ncbi:MAG: PQQ-binding-like beta-propeller repeat protein [Planctomycetota bacterium]|nr:PQQ-binding-like beta-propeller repeat protein [Planctomycetota bacterium]
MRRCLFLLIVLVSPTLVQSQETTDREAEYVSFLKAEGIEPTQESITAFFASIAVTAERSAILDNLFAQLGHPDFSQRELAMKNLEALKFIPGPYFDRAIGGNDLEIRWRAKLLTARTSPHQSSLLFAVLHVAESRRVHGLTNSLLHMLPFCGHSYLREQVLGTLVATIRPQDELVLRTTLTSKDPQLRQLSVAALERLLSAKFDDELRRFCNDPADAVRFAAARGLVNHGNHEGLATLARLLESPEAAIRTKSLGLLRHLSGESFGYVAYLPTAADSVRQAKQIQSIAKWHDWIAKSGPAANWKTPISDVKYELGRILCCGYSTNKIYEMDLSGNILWEQTVAAYPWGCHGLPNGHRVLGSYREKRVTEYDAAGRIVWEKTNLPGGASCVWRLANNNTLVTCTDANRVLEIAPDKSIVWTTQIDGRPTDARRLPNGRTLISLQSASRIVEVDTTGKVVWEIRNVKSPLSSQRLASGNTLVCSAGKGGSIIEFDADGRVVWSVDTFNSPWCAQRLENGNTLVTDLDGITEINPAGRRVWFTPQKGIGKLHRY